MIPNRQDKERIPVATAISNDRVTFSSFGGVAAGRGGLWLAAGRDDPGWPQAKVSGALAKVPPARSAAALSLFPRPTFALSTPLSDSAPTLLRP